MRRALSTLSALCLLAFAPACDAEPDDSTGDSFRNQILDVDIKLMLADGGDDDGSIPWEILQTEIFEGEAAAGNLSLFIEDNVIYTAEGVQTCVVNSPYLNSSIREVVAANGTDVLFTVWNQYVFDGEVDVKIENYGQMKKKFGDQLLFEFKSDEIFLGEVRDGYRLLRASADVQSSSEGRKLVIAALITGECGSSGLAGYTF